MAVPPGGAGAMIPGSQMIQNLRAYAGGRPIRYSSALDSLSNAPLVLRVPKDVMANEHNVALGLPRTGYAAAANLPMSVTAPRQVIVRDLAVEEVSLATGAVGTKDYTMQAMTIEAETLSIAVGSPISVFSPFARNRPSFDLPCKGGNPITVQWINNSAVAGVLAGCIYID